jgi:hypothetical protein
LNSPGQSDIDTPSHSTTIPARDSIAANLTAILLAGSNAPLPVEHAFMPPFARGHSDDELAAVANFVNGFFGKGQRKSPPPI